ncbi:oxidoreductase [Bacillus coahuilensis m2-6]|uniref:Oxidoreductase n=1 Tax=Bacillus coahuilensis p1.1.43 TaxID=1150625 RepID=A0A147K808_9BACI|nr:aldo/keto reductase [Bacillus coahuilensis]KUP06272.1 oxidoreductase [Bacillus coahuilensis p1.1.43]KUP07690.1 oxidoreductase [Bacillus coahuilensis m2-6]
MEKRQIGSSSIMVSKLGLGCMSLGTDETKAREIVEAALEGGITYFDTADLYDFGQNEEILGKILQPYRDQIVISTKVGNRWNHEKTSWTWDPSKEHIKESVKQSLHRLKTDYIDLYQLHGGTIQDNIEESIEAFEELKDEGYIKEYGISSIRLNVIKQYAEKSTIQSNMMQYSLLDRRPEEIFPILEDHTISVITRGPVAKGLLTNSMLNKATNKILDQGYLDYTYEELKSVLLSIQDRFHSTRNMNELALQYNLSHSAVASVIPGASSVLQVTENIAAVNKDPLTKEEVDLLKGITKQSIYQEHRE